MLRMSGYDSNFGLNSFNTFRMPPKPKKVTIRKSKMFLIYKEIWSDSSITYNVEVMNYRIKQQYFLKEKKMKYSFSGRPNCGLTAFIQTFCRGIDWKISKDKSLVYFFFSYDETEYMYMERIPKKSQITDIMRYVKEGEYTSTEKPNYVKTMWRRYGPQKKKQIKKFFEMLNSKNYKEEACIAQCYYIIELIIKYFEKLGIRIVDSFDDCECVHIDSTVIKEVIVEKPDTKVVEKVVEKVVMKEVIKEIEPPFKYPSLKSEKAGGNEIECNVCLLNRINTIILDCKHACLCSDCALAILNNKKECPICRKEIKKGIDDLFL